VIVATFAVVGGEPNVVKHLDQFNRRARDGRCFHRPYLGCREFPAEFALVEREADLPRSDWPGPGRLDLGWMLDDITYVADTSGPIVDGQRGMRWRAEPQFYRARMVNGVIDVATCRTTAVGT